MSAVLAIFKMFSVFFNDEFLSHFFSHYGHIPSPFFSCDFDHLLCFAYL